MNKPDNNFSEILKSLEQRLFSIFGSKLKKIILYGSYARGDYDLESDVDILMVTEDEDSSGYNKEISQLEIDFFKKYNLLFSILVENEKYFSANEDLLPFFRSVKGEGVLVYGWLQHKFS